MEPRGHAGDAAGKEFAALGQQAFEKLGILIVDCLRGEVDAAAGHRTVGATKRRATLRSLGLHGRLFDFAVKRLTLQVGLYFFFSSRFGVRGLFLLRVEMYRERGLPSAFASVHSRMTKSWAMVLILCCRSCVLLLPRGFFVGETKEVTTALSNS